MSADSRLQLLLSALIVIHSGHNIYDHFINFGGKIMWSWWNVQSSVSVVLNTHFTTTLTTFMGNNITILTIVTYLNKIIAIVIFISYSLMQTLGIGKMWPNSGSDTSNLLANHAGLLVCSPGIMELTYVESTVFNL